MGNCIEKLNRLTSTIKLKNTRLSSSNDRGIGMAAIPKKLCHFHRISDKRPALSWVSIGKFSNLKLGGVETGPFMCSKFKAFNLTYLHVLRS